MEKITSLESQSKNQNEKSTFGLFARETASPARLSNKTLFKTEGRTQKGTANACCHGKEVKENF